MPSSAAALLLLAAAAAGAREPADFESEFAPPGDVRMAVGPLPPGEAALALDVGWLRSGIRLDVGLVAGVDLVFSADAFLLTDLLSGQNVARLGLRYSPLGAGAFRASLEATGGIYFLPQVLGTETSGELRLGAVAAYAVEPLGLAYVRGAGRFVRFAQGRFKGWGENAEVGLGAETRLWGVLVGAEWFSWIRPGLPALPQWRLRVGFPL